MRPIDADALIEVVEKSMAENPHKEETQRAMHIHEHKYFLTLLAGIPTIQPEKAQLSKEGTTSDLISRTETTKRLRGVIDVTVPITDYDGGFIDGVEVGISTVSTMPTIQPQSTAGQLNDGARSTARSTDLIDRQQAIDIVVFECGKWTGLAKEISKQLKQLPPAQPEPKWIPCSERLPEEPGYYITSNEYNGVGEDFYYDGHFWLADKNAYEVIAWMPKPEHYKPNNK